ncbi:MAG: hypothetical protein Q7U71_00680 [bacterium]|nr:hypothetical protein [bacterium]
MKKTLLAALLVMVISSWCLAQTDSLPAPTAEPCQPATCSEPCQPAACSGPCQTGTCAAPCQPVVCAEPFVPKWAVGMKASSLTNLPGTFIVEKLLFNKLSLSMGCTYGSNKSESQNRSEDSLGVGDTTSAKSKYWSITLIPELTYIFKKSSGWSYAANGSISYYYYNRKEENYYGNYYYMPRQITETEEKQVSLSVGLSIERQIKIKSKEMSIGLATSFINLSTNKYSNITNYYDDNFVYTGRYVYDRNTPWGVSITNPLRAGASISIKYWF